MEFRENPAGVVDSRRRERINNHQSNPRETLMTGAYLDESGDWRHGEIPAGAATDGREWLRRQAVAGVAKAQADLNQALRGITTPPAQRVTKLGKLWYATTVSGDRVPSAFKTRKAAIDFLLESDPFVTRNRRDALEDAQRLLSQYA